MVMKKKNAFLVSGAGLLVGVVLAGVISEVMGGSVSKEQGEILAFLDE